MERLLVLLRLLYEVYQPIFWYSDLKAYSAETERCERAMLYSSRQMIISY